MHTYVDEADNTLIVTDRPGPRLVTKTLIPTEDDQAVIEHVASVTAPKGDAAVALARAVLAAAGDAGHTVTSWREYHLALRNAREEGARSMRDRAAQEVLIDTHRVPMAVSEAISALPLLSDEPAARPEDDAHREVRILRQQRNDLRDQVRQLEGAVHDFRERAVRASESYVTFDAISSAIRALPLLPDA